MPAKAGILIKMRKVNRENQKAGIHFLLWRKKRKLFFGLFFYIIMYSPLYVFPQEKRGADISWTTYEAENMQTTGKVLGALYMPYYVETESSGQKCVQLTHHQYVLFTATTVANTMIVRYSLPDAPEGGGLHSQMDIYINQKFIGHYSITSRYCMLYGKYPFTNNPQAGKPRHFYDELRIKNLSISTGDIVKILFNAGGGNAKTCIIDLVDLEKIAPPFPMPSNAVSLTDSRFKPIGNDYTEALRKCIALAKRTGKMVWIPKGAYKITGDIVLPSGISIQGAGMWYATFVGDSILYNNEENRIRFLGNGDSIHLSDFAIIGKLTYRNDQEANDGIVGVYGKNSTIKNLWIEHTKAGIWVENSTHLLVQNCRLRNTMADGINFCIGMNQSVIENCTTRGTGDDCFAIWPTVYKPQLMHPGNNLIIHCTGQLPFLANGVGIYGGEGNEIRNCVFTDISAGSAILISTTFPTEDKSKNINNNFSGTTVVANCTIRTSGGFDHEWDWRGAIELCLDKRNISGIRLQNIDIDSSLFNAIDIITKTVEHQFVTLSNTSFSNVRVAHYGISKQRSYGLYIADSVQGKLIITQSNVGKIKNNAKQLHVALN